MISLKYLLYVLYLHRHDTTSGLEHEKIRTAQANPFTIMTFVSDHTVTTILLTIISLHLTRLEYYERCLILVSVQCITPP